MTAALAARRQLPADDPLGSAAEESSGHAVEESSGVVEESSSWGPGEESSGAGEESLATLPASGRRLLRAGAHA